MSQETTTTSTLDKGNGTLGPYRATRLWNDVLRTFRSMPTSRHRRYMKTYDACFVASEGIDWLHQKLQENPNFGQAVTRSQTTQLLQKFHKAKLFEDVRGPNKNDEFSDGGRLFRFTPSSPVKTRKTPPRAPLGNKGNTTWHGTGLAGPLKAPSKEMKKSPPDPPPEQASSQPQQPARAGLTVGEMEDIWKSETLQGLQRTLQLHSMEQILDKDQVNAKNVIHNMTHVNRNGIVTNIDKEDQLPHWIISAMRCLAHWPDKVEENLPDYPGFENDVFKLVKDYFESMDEPLVTYTLYEVFMNVLCLIAPVQKNRLQEALQVCTLFLPPENRRKLHLLLRLMHKMVHNPELKLDEEMSIRDLVMQTFARCILQSEEEADFDEILAIHMVEFLVDNYVEVMKTPETLRLRIEERIAYTRRAKVSSSEYEKQRMSSSQGALVELLDNIVQDRNMSSKDKKKKLKQFQKNHPEIYSQKFPTSESETALFPQKPKIKPPLLKKPLQRLKSIRL